MGRLMVFTYGVAAYVLALAAILYLIGFVGGIAVPRSVHGSPAMAWWLALLIDAGLVGLFGLQHTVMARPSFKRWWTRVVPTPAERSTYVLIAAVLLGLLMSQWQPVAGTVWEVASPAARTVLWALFAIGWALVFYTTFLIDHFDLFGLRQVWLHLRGRPYEPPRFVERSVYKWVRHPLMLGFIVAFWAAPTMSASRLAFALLMTAYILIGVAFEERDLRGHHGVAYEEYRRRVGMLLPYRAQ